MWKLCDQCLEAIRSREPVMSRRATETDCTETEYTEGYMMCDWCYDFVELSEMNVCKEK